MLPYDWLWLKRFSNSTELPAMRTGVCNVGRRSRETPGCLRRTRVAAPGRCAHCRAQCRSERDGPCAGKVPLPAYNGYHSRFNDHNEPNIPYKGMDPWDYPRRLAWRTIRLIPSRFDAPDRHDASNAGRGARKSTSCIACHTDVGHMHPINSVRIGCTDCHGGNADCSDIRQAHVPARFPEVWKGAANPVRSYTLLNHESPEFVRFVNPGDSRVAHIACGQCHAKEVLQLRTSMMTHGCMLWGAALYNNGGVSSKRPRYGESYSMHGVPQRVMTVPAPTEEEIRKKGVLPFLEPLIPYQISQPGNILRIFERGGRFRAETGIPERLEEAGRPRERLSNRGMGTENRTDPVFIGLQKTRLLDPTLNFMGTNDHPGDYRSSGCSACHVLYANDRDRLPAAFSPNMATGDSRPRRQTIGYKRSIQLFRKLNQAIRFSTSSSCACRPASAWYATFTPAPTC